MPTISNYKGIIPAIACPFTAEHKIDEPGLRKLASWLSTQPGVVAVMTNGHTGEVFSLTPDERAQVTRIVASEIAHRTPVVSSIVCEGLRDARVHAEMAKKAGATALDVMPPHHWLRFGFRPSHVREYFDAIAESGLDLIAHVYPAWTRASYSTATMAELAKSPYLQAFKVGQRDMNKYAADVKAVRDADPTKAILTCHDEYLLSSLLSGSDGALVGFAGFVPELIIALVTASLSGNLAEANRLQETVYKFNKIVYRFGEPTSDAHQRMKIAMTMQGRFPSINVRPPLRKLSNTEMDRIRREVDATPYTFAKS